MRKLTDISRARGKELYIKNRSCEYERACQVRVAATTVYSIYRVNIPEVMQLLEIFLSLTCCNFVLGIFGKIFIQRS